MLTIDYVSLPNIIANKPIVKELLQDNATVENIKNEMLKILDHQNQISQITEFTDLHQSLIAQADIQSANAIDLLMN